MGRRVVYLELTLPVWVVYAVKSTQNFTTRNNISRTDPFSLHVNLPISDHMIAEWPIKENHFRSRDLKWVILHTG